MRPIRFYPGDRPRASLAATLITTEAVVTDIPEPKGACAVHGGAGMPPGGMGEY